MKIKTSELIGPALDWAVAKCLEYDCTIPSWTGASFTALINGSDIFFNPSTDWSQGGPIIEQMMRRHVESYIYKEECYFELFNGARTWVEKGPTSLVAAMRCHVTSKLGDEVDVPDELCLSS